MEGTSDDSLENSPGDKSSDCGYYVGNLSKLDPRYLCSKCHLLLRDPMQGDCGHRYCKNCVHLSDKEARSRGGQEYLCKVCEEESSQPCIISPDHTYPDNALRREINKTLKVQCPNSPCGFTGFIADVLDHATGECEFKPQQCDLCRQDVPAASLKSGQHKREFCPKRSVPCAVCQEEVPADFMEEHLAVECMGVTQKCSYCLRRIRDGMSEMENHLLNECKVGWHDGKPCPYGCSAEVPDGGKFEFEKHRESHRATHLDLVMALKLKTDGATSQQQSAVPESIPHQIPSQTPVSASAAAAAAPEAQYHIDYDKTMSLKEKLTKAELRLMEHQPVPESRRNDEQQAKARELLGQLQIALTQGDKIGELVGAIRKQLENCCEDMRQHEINIKKSDEKMVDFGRRRQEMTKLLAYQETRIRDMQKRAELLEHGGSDGTLMWRIKNVKRRIDEARDGKMTFFHSPPFFTSKAGYKMCGRIYLNGDGAGKHTHVSLYFCIMRGEYDALQPWPFAQTVTITLIDPCNLDNSWTLKLKPDPKSASFSRRPTSEMNPPSGFSKFVPLNAFERFIENDSVFVKFSVDRNDLPM